MRNFLKNIKKYQFILEELTKRDFKKKYKGTILGMLWSLISPLLTLLVMKIVFTTFFGRDTPHYTIYLFAGNLNYSFFKQSTSGGMGALMANSGVITKINVPKFLFLLSKNWAAVINYLLTLIIFFVFVAFDGLPFRFSFLLLLYPVICIIVFNIGVGMVLSALFVFFKDIQYLYDVFTLLVMYLSAIFYSISSFPQQIQKLFLLNPIFVYINYFRSIVIDNSIPNLHYHFLCFFYAAIMLILGIIVYRRKNYRFVYYM